MIKQVNIIAAAMIPASGIHGRRYISAVVVGQCDTSRSVVYGVDVVIGATVEVGTVILKISH